VSGFAPPLEAVLLLHGQPGSARDWARVLAQLDPGIQVLAPDRPGWNGHSPAAGLEVNGEAALAAMDAAGVERAVVVGHSYGGAVAAWLAAHHPERVARLVLAAPAANGASLYKLDRILALPLIGALVSTAMLGAAGTALQAPGVRRLLAERSRMDAAYLDSLSRTLLSPPAWRAFVTEQRAMVRDLPVLERDLRRITAETVIIAGTADRIVPAIALRMLAAQIPRARLVWVPGAGHLLPYLHPERLSEAIEGRVGMAAAG
jgi:pimeloyl-ACP methyl ester carboxylesterase